MQSGVTSSWEPRASGAVVIWKLKVDSCFSAKLGDTKELEDFIADLDRTLASEYMPGIKKKKSNRKPTNTHC